ncbi:MAG: Na/Pi cotransporter family protein [Chloroflexota bacterium]
MISIVQILGGMALFLYGVRVLSSGMEKIAGHKLQEWLDRMTNRPIKGAAFGAVATALIQSSSLLMVTMIGLINANLMTLEQVIGVMLGQEIGTTLTAQIIAFKVGDFSFIFIAVGLGMMEFSSKRSWQRLGEVILGFGVIFVGMQTMSGALKSVAQIPIVQTWLAYMGQHYLTGILAGTIATAVVQSSSAITGLVVAMGISQVISLPGAIAILLGANIGTCVTGLIASLQLSNASRRASVAQILINIIGVLIFLPFVTPFAKLVASTSSSLPRQIANAHTIFNVGVSAILFPFIKTITRASERLVPKTEAEEQEKLTQFIDDSQYRFPTIALNEATRELNRVGEITGEMIELGRLAIIENNADAAQEILFLETDVINPLCVTLENFINTLLQDDIGEDQTRYALHLKEMITDVERVSDLVWDLANIAQYNTPPRDIIGEQSAKDLNKMFKQTHRVYGFALQAVLDNDQHMAQLTCSMEEDMDHKYWKARKKLTKRSKAGKSNAKADLVYLEILRNLERISDHADSLSISVMRD